MHPTAPRILALALAAALTGCPAPRRPTPPPPPPPDLGELLPPDAPLTAVARPPALRDALAGLGLGGLPGLPGPDASVEAWLGGLGIDPQRPVWIGARTGPVLGVLRAAEDAERVLADVAADPIADPRLASLDPFAGWLDAHPLPPTWAHIRLVGHPRDGADGRPVSPEAWLTRAGAALAAAGPRDPTETLAALLDIEAAPAGALQAALAAHQPTIYRLLDIQPPTLLMAHRRRDPHPATVIDIVWDGDLGPGGLAAGLAALPEVGGAWTGPRTPTPGAPAPGELLRVELDHGRWIAAARMRDEVRALQRVVGQGPTPAEAHETLAAARAAALVPGRLMAPTARLFAASRLSISAVEGGLRARLEVDARSGGLAALRDGTAPADPGLVADALDPRGPPAFALTLAQPPAALGRALGPHIGPPDRSITALIEALDQCGAACLPAAWTAPLAYGRDLPAAIAAASGYAPLDAALAEATGITGLWIGEAFGAAVGHKAPATLPRAAWAPIVSAASLEDRWLIGDRAVMIAGRGEALEVLTRAARAPAVTDAALLRFTAIGPGAIAGLRIDGAVAFDGRGMTVDAVIDRAPPTE